MMNLSRSRFQPLWCFIFGILTSVSLPAHADVLIYPTRLVLEDGNRAAKLELVNRSSEPATFRIFLVNRRMNEYGEFSPAEPPLPEERFASQLIRYSPRQVRIEPGESQTVRLAVRKPANLDQGEYRSHLLFEKQPDVGISSSVESIQGSGSGGIEVRLQALVGISIPVIVRHGKLSATVVLSNLGLEASTPDANVLRFEIARTGGQSIYGDITVTLSRAQEEQVVARARGVAVYFPNPLRIARLKLPSEISPLQPGDRLTVRFTTPVDQGERLLAEAALLIP
ncbi:molecular chaperone [Marinobacter sediminum]|uniref:fimbrial biogenesis chaperone n=1 Tax=Marinobacter sediminum TaxID=256323 RepID=UPI0019393382|nr:molecular chaperone [Marinobacter sediminum]